MVPAKEGISGEENQLQHYINICEIVEGDVSAEVISTDLEGMIMEGEKLASLHPQITVKIPMIKEGVKALKYFSEKKRTPVFFLGPKEEKWLKIIKKYVPQSIFPEWGKFRKKNIAEHCLG